MRHLEEAWKVRVEAWRTRVGFDHGSAYRVFYRTLKKPEQCIFLGGQRFVTVDKANIALGLLPKDDVLIERSKNFFDFKYTGEVVPIVDGGSNFKRHRFINRMFQVSFEDNRVVSFGDRSKTLYVYENGLGQFDIKTKTGRSLRVIGRLKILGKRFIVNQYKIDRLRALGIRFRLIPREKPGYDLLVPNIAAGIVQDELDIEPVSYTVTFGNSIIMEGGTPPFVVNGKPKEIISMRKDINENLELEGKLMESPHLF